MCTCLCSHVSPSSSLRVLVVVSVIIRTALIPFGCTTSNGVSVVTAEPSIQCSPTNGTYVRMRLVASLSLALYGLGLPVVFAYFLYRHRAKIDLDQQLRVKGEGETSLTNPNIHIRRRFRKLYEDYKPEYKYWKLVLIARKLALAITGILMYGNPSLQVRQLHPPEFD